MSTPFMPLLACVRVSGVPFIWASLHSSSRLDGRVAVSESDGQESWFLSGPSNFFKNWFFREMEGGQARETKRQTETKTSTCCSTYWHIHWYWLILVRALTGDWTDNLGVSEWRCNQLSHPARAKTRLFSNSSEKRSHSTRNNNNNNNNVLPTVPHSGKLYH